MRGKVLEYVMINAKNEASRRSLLQLSLAAGLAAGLAATFAWSAGDPWGRAHAADTGPPKPAAAAPLDLRSSTALVMIEDRGCPYCQRFDAESRSSYENSAEGHLVPLVRRFRGDPEIAFLERVVYSPTFVLLVEGREVGRALGYQGSDLFWMEIAGLMRRSGLM